MARSKPPKDLSASILAGSEELYDFFCQPCSSEQHLEAAGYCKDCSQYLCVACIKVHSKLAGTAHHTVLDKSTMPKTKLRQKILSTDILTEKCKKHPDKVLEYFCKTHDQICCSVCVTLDHSSCSGKNYIPVISGGIANSQECLKLKAEIDRLVREITKRQKQINNGRKNNETYYYKALADIKKFRKQINELLDKIEENAKRKVTKFHQENIGVIASASEKCHALLSGVNSMAANMDTSAKAGKNNQLFVQVKLFCNSIAEVERKMNENGECNITGYAFYQDMKIQQMMSTLSAIWSLSVRQDDLPIKARFVREVKVKADDYAKECTITGVAVLTNDRMVVTDDENNNVKLIDMRVNKVVSRLSVSPGPFDITEINPNQVAVVYGIGQDTKIGIIIVSGVLSLIKTIAIPGTNIAGLRYKGSNFITVCQYPSSVKIIDISGKTLATFNADCNGEQLSIDEPEYIALSRDENVAYITDSGANTLTSMTLRCQVISVYRHAKLKKPLGVAVGKDGAVYVCSQYDTTIHQLTPTGDLKRIILDPDKELANWPIAIAYNDEDDRLYISSNSKAPELRNYIRLYQLE